MSTKKEGKKKKSKQNKAKQNKTNYLSQAGVAQNIYIKQYYSFERRACSFSQFHPPTLRTIDHRWWFLSICIIIITVRIITVRIMPVGSVQATKPLSLN